MLLQCDPHIPYECRRSMRHPRYTYRIACVAVIFGTWRINIARTSNIMKLPHISDLDGYILISKLILIKKIVLDLQRFRKEDTFLTYNYPFSSYTYSWKYIIPSTYFLQIALCYNVCMSGRNLFELRSNINYRHKQNVATKFNC